MDTHLSMTPSLRCSVWVCLIHADVLQVLNELKVKYGSLYRQDNVVMIVNVNVFGINLIRL